MILRGLKIMKTVVVLVSMSLLLGGCIGRSSPKVTYYSLMTMEQLGETQTVASLGDTSLGIGPVTIPESLQRSQIVTRQQANQYEFNEFNRWVGMLEKDLADVLGDNLGQLLGVDMVSFFPWSPHVKPDYRIIVDIQRLDGSPAGEVVLSARWTVADAEGREMLAAGKSDYRQPVDDASFAALVKAESQLVAALSQEIAGVIVAVVK